MWEMDIEDLSWWASGAVWISEKEKES